MIKLLNILQEIVVAPNPVLHAVYQKILDYIQNGSQGDLNLRKVDIKRLPKNLKVVRGHLYLTDTSKRITETHKHFRATFRGFPLKSLRTASEKEVWMLSLGALPAKDFRFRESESLMIRETTSTFLSSGTWSISDQRPSSWKMFQIFYRSLRTLS